MYLPTLARKIKLTTFRIEADRKNDEVLMSMVWSNLENSEFPYLSKKAQENLKLHGWSGNVRELENVILRSIVLSNSININSEHIIVDESVQNHNEYYQQLEDKIFALGN